MRAACTSRGIRIAAWLWVLTCIAALALYESHVHALLDLRPESELIRARGYIPYVAAILSAGLALIHMRRALPFPLLAHGISVALLVISLRTLVVNNASGEIIGYWAGIPVSRTVLTRINSTGYCYRVRPLFLEIQSLHGNDRIEYVRGFWPAEALQRAMIFAECVPRPPE